MQRIKGAILAVYHFFVGDPIILSGVAITFILVALLTHMASTPPALLSGLVLVIGVVASLGLALLREIRPKA